MHAQIVQRVVHEAGLEGWRLLHEAAACHYLVDDELGLVGGQIQAFFFLSL